MSVQTLAAQEAQVGLSGEAGELIEIRWHGRGGQGAKTAALLMGEAAAGAGRYIQAFPEYGPERMGAPVVAYNRISMKPIGLHCSIEIPGMWRFSIPRSWADHFTAGIPDGGVLL